MKKTYTFLFVSLLILVTGCAPKTQKLTDLVNPFLGTATIWDSTELGYKCTYRPWGAEAFPGSSVPNAMVQATPITLFGSGSGYQYEDTVIYGFAHTSKGHWNLLHVPLMPVSGDIDPNDYKSSYKHSNESAGTGYYQVFLERYGINAEVTSTLRCAYHKFTYPKGDAKKLLMDLSKSNERVRAYELQKAGDNVFTGFQKTGETMYFYAVSNHNVLGVDSVFADSVRQVKVVNFAEGTDPLELKIGFSFVSIENAKANLEAEMLSKNFAEVRTEAIGTWETLLSKIKVTGGTPEQQKTFYSSLYRSFLWPALRSDVNHDYTDEQGVVTNQGFHYYTDPSFWDDYRNKLVLLGMLSPEVTADVIKSLTDKGEKRGGFMPTFFHGDHASAFLAGTYLRGVGGYDIQRAYQLVLNNAVKVEGNRIRPWLDEYIKNGYIAEKDIDFATLKTPTLAKASVTKTLEYSYDDYSVALLAKELGDTASYNLLMKRTGNYKNLFDPSTGLMRARLDNGKFVEPFDPKFPYYEYMYREANAWQSSFFAPHDTKGLIGLYPSEAAFETMLDSLFTIPWQGYEAHNMTSFIGQYCHGNQPDHGFPHLYTFIGKQEKTQVLLDTLLNYFYNRGTDNLALAGMDDAGEMSSWYVFNAIGLYTYSPADPQYLISVPLFDKVEFMLGDKSFTVSKPNAGRKIKSVTYGGQKVEGMFISHQELLKGLELVIETE